MRERSRDQIQMGDGLSSRRAPPRTATEKTCGVWKLSGSGLAGSLVAKTMRPPGVDAALTAPTRISPPRQTPSTTRATRVSNADRRVYVLDVYLPTIVITRPLAVHLNPRAARRDRSPFRRS